MEENKNKILNVPTLRFNEFTTNWQSTTLKNVCEYRKIRRTTEKKNYVSTENIMQNFQGVERFISAEYISGDGFNKNDILMGNIRPYLKKVCFADFDGVCNADVLVFNSKTINPKFLYYVLANDNFINYVMSSVKGSKMPRGDKNFIMQYPLSLPSETEQLKISDFIGCLTKRIQVQNKIISDLKVLKKELCNKVFSKGSAVRLGGFIEEVTTRNKLNSCENVLSVSNKMGFIKQSEQFEDRTVASENKSNYKVVTEGCFAYNPARINVGSIALLSTYKIGIISPMYVCFKAKSALDSEYLNFYYQSDFFYKELQKKLEGSVRQCLTYENMSEILIPYVGIEEQKAIAATLNKFATLIANEEKYLKSLQKQKSYFLNAMFI